MDERKVIQKKGSLLISRRAFLKGAGTGAATAAAMQAGLIRWDKAEAHVSEILPSVGRSTITLTVNGRKYRAEIENRLTLAELLRYEMGLTGTKVSCDRGECGACTVIMNGRKTYSCATLAVQADGADILTIEGLAKGNQLHPIQQAFIDNDAYQCGFCTCGHIMGVKDLLDRNPNPTAEEVRVNMSDHLCRCGAYQNIVKAALDAAKKLAS